MRLRLGFAILALSASLAQAGGYVPVASLPAYTDAQAQAANAASIAAAQSAAIASIISQFPSLEASNCIVCSVNGKTGSIVTATLPGVYTVQSSGANPLPLATANVGRYANVGDLAGVGAGGTTGTGLVYSNGVCWSRFRTQTATVQPVSLSSAVSITALTMSSLLQLTGSGFSQTATINITGACQGDVFRILFPAGLMSVTGLLGISINGTLPVNIPALAGATTGSWADYALNGTSVVKVAGGQL